MLEYKIKLKPDEEITAICAIENTIAHKKMTLNKLDCEPLRDFQKKEINRLINFLASLKNKQLINRRIKKSFIKLDNYTK